MGKLASAFVFSILLSLCLAIQYQCRNPSEAHYVSASLIKCDRDLRAQCACGSWCGIAGPPTTDDTTPKCVPRIDTPDAPPPKDEGGNPCPLSQCPYQTFNLITCPEGWVKYQYIGASCNRVDGACVWQLPYCDPVYPPKGAKCNPARCPATKPAPAGTVTCPGWFNGVFEGHYECLETGFGKCEWEWIDCPGAQTCPPGVQRLDTIVCSFSGKETCQYNLPLAIPNPAWPNLPKECGASGLQLLSETCGGCNCRVLSNGLPVCQAQTWRKPFDPKTSTGIQCKDDYKYVSDVFPFCAPIKPVTCASLGCAQRGEDCFEMATKEADGVFYFQPKCHPKVGYPQTMSFTCDQVSCQEGYKCQDSPSGWSCVFTPRPCVIGTDCTSASRVKCWDGSFVGGPGCSQKRNGACEWDYAPCPDYNVPKSTTTSKGTVLNCQVSAWTEWSCGAPCGQYTKRTRIRSITQKPTSNISGVQCPNLLEAGDECQGSGASCAAVPTTARVTSFFTSGGVPFPPIPPETTTPLYNPSAFISSATTGAASGTGTVNSGGGAATTGAATGPSASGGAGTTAASGGSAVATGPSASGGAGTTAGTTAASGGSAVATGPSASGGAGTTVGGTGVASGGGTVSGSPGASGGGTTAGGSSATTGGGTASAGGATANGGNPNNDSISGPGGALQPWVYAIIAIVIIIVIIVAVIIIICCCFMKGAESV